MDVAALRSKVTFQKNETVTDKYGNHKNAWTDYYTCFATIGGEGLASSKEEQVAGTTVEDFSMTVPSGTAGRLLRSIPRISE